MADVNCHFSPTRMNHGDSTPVVCYSTGNITGFATGLVLCLYPQPSGAYVSVATDYVHGQNQFHFDGSALAVGTYVASLYGAPYGEVGTFGERFYVDPAPTISAPTTLYAVGEAQDVHVDGDPFALTIADMIAGTATVIRFYPTGVGAPALTVNADWTYDAARAAVRALSLNPGIYDVDILVGTVASNKLTAAFRAIPAPAISSASPDPAAVDVTVTLAGVDFTYCSALSVESMVPDGTSFAPGITLLNDAALAFTMADVGKVGQVQVAATFAKLGGKTAQLSPAFTYQIGSAVGVGPSTSTFEQRVVLDPEGDDELGGGSDAAPWRTYAKAMAATTGRVVVVLNSGAYTETFAIVKDRDVLVYSRGLAFLDGENARSCISIESQIILTPAVPATPLAAEVPAVLSGRACAVFVNVIFRNPKASVVARKTGAGQGLGLEDGQLTFVNCAAYHDDASVEWFFAIITNCTNFVIQARRFTALRMSRWIESPLPGSNVGCALILSDFVQDPGHRDAGAAASANKMVMAPLTTEAVSPLPSVGNEGLAISIEGNIGFPLADRITYALPGAVSHFDTCTVTLSYADYTFPDPDLSMGLQFQGYGVRGGYGCSEWYPVIGMQYGMGPGQYGGGLASANLWMDPASGGVYESDPDYPDDVHQGKMLRLPVDFANTSDLQQGDCWQIDLDDNPDATSGRLAPPIVKVRVKNGDTATLKWGVAEGDEDLTPASGSKQVIDCEQASSSRQYEYRWSYDLEDLVGDVTAWTAATFGYDLNIPITRDFYLQVRPTIRTDGV